MGKVRHAALAAPVAAAAQQQQPAPVPMVPGVGNFSLPGTPSPTPTPRPTPTGSEVTPPATTPTPRPSPTPRVVASPTPRPSPSAAETPRIAPSALPSPSASAASSASVTSDSVAAPPSATLPTPEASPRLAPAPVATSSEIEGLPFWLIPATVLGLVLIGGLIVGWRRRANAVTALSAPVAERPPLPPAPPPLEATPAEPPRFLEPVAVAATTVGRAWIEFEVRPRRAGVNMLTATADIDIVVRNVGGALARQVQVEAHLSSARVAQDEALGRLFAEPIERPVVTPFELAPGAERTIRSQLAIDRNQLNVLIAAERPMYVPVVAVNIVYAHDADHVGQTAAAFAIGVEREGVTKLAPFWLDTPSRMHDALGLRPHALALKS